MDVVAAVAAAVSELVPFQAPLPSVTRHSVERGQGGEASEGRTLRGV
jgi:hypothetical protein